MKKLVSLFIAVPLLFGLCACNGNNAGTSSDKDSMTAATSSAANSEATDSNAGADGEMSGNFVTVEETQTKCGVIQTPQIDVKLSDSEHVRLANDMFQSIRDRLLARVEECEKEWGDEIYHDASEPLCVARYTQKGNILSVTVKYIELYPYSTSMEFYEAVNLDVTTGKALDHHDVIKSAGFTEDEVKAALRCYADRFSYFEWEHQAFYACADERKLPDGLGDPSPVWQDEIDKSAASYDTPAPPLGEPWDSEPWYEALPHYPAVYVGKDGFEVGFRVSTAAGGGEYETMVRIGHNNAETILLNPNTPSGMPFGRGAMSLDAAYEAVSKGKPGLDHTLTDVADVKYSISADSMAIITSEEQSELVYVFHVYTDEGDHVATLGWYAVGAFSGTQWEMDIISGEWTSLMNGTGLLPEDVVTGAHANGALATIWNDPSSYGIWSANPRTNVNLVEYGSSADNEMSNSELLTLFAVEDGTFVSFETGAMEGDSFASKSRIWSLTLNAGESVNVFLNRPETPTQAIIVRTADDVGTYVIKRHNADDMPKTEYITSDSAAG